MIVSTRLTCVQPAARKASVVSADTCPRCSATARAKRASASSLASNEARPRRSSAICASVKPSILPKRRVGSEAIVAVVDLAHSEVDRLALLRFQGRPGVLQREICAKRGRRMREGRIEVRDETERLLQIVEERLVVRCDVVAGRNRKNC